jgi:hypothetical protein
MPVSKMKLPSNVPSNAEHPSEALQKALLSNERTAIDATAKKEVAQLQVAKEALSVIKAIAGVVKSAHQLEATRDEWNARIALAQVAVTEAELAIANTRESLSPRMEELRQTKEAQDRVLQLFDFILAEFSTASLNDEAREQTRRSLFELADKLVKLRG